MRLVVFDCDGTLIDSQAAIIHAMRVAFAEAGREAPDDDAIRSIVGLSVPQAVASLAAGEDEATIAKLDKGFRAASIAYRLANPDRSAPLYPGALEALERLDAAGAMMAIATGKARRGLEHTLDVYDLRRYFIATQSADDAPSKPHPGMLENCERMTGAVDMVMIGDTTFDMMMAVNHGCRAIGVSWGYHPAEALLEAGASLVVDDFSALDDALAGL